MIQMDARIGGVTRYRITDMEVPLMMIPDEIRKCAVFLAYRLPDGSVRLAGTAFLVSRKIHENLHMQYIVTAKHVIDGIKNNGSNGVLIRLNLKDGTAVWVEQKLSEWYYHPVDPDTVDVCVSHFGFGDDVDQKYYPLESIVTKEVLIRDQIGPGEEVFVTGLFLHHVGTGRSVPIVRVGNVAALPEERVNTRIGMIEAYLVECRSTSGLSGSPVFLHLGMVRKIDGQIKFAVTAHGGISYLMGLMHGHFQHKDGDLDLLINGEPDRINSGIAIVVPIWNVVEVIEQPTIKQKDDALIRQWEGASLPTMDGLAQ